MLPTILTARQEPFQPQRGDNKIEHQDLPAINKTAKYLGVSCYPLFPISQTTFLIDILFPATSLQSTANILIEESYRFQFQN